MPPRIRTEMGHEFLEFAKKTKFRQKPQVEASC